MSASDSKVFGYKCAWLAIKDRTPTEIMKALKIVDAKRTEWFSAIVATYQFNTRDVFVSPSVADWVFVVGLSGLPRPSTGNTEWIRFVGDLSRDLKTTVQYFITHRVVELHGWLCANNGTITRAYAFVAESNEVLANEGQATAVERSLGVPEQREPKEQDVMAIAASWSIDPQTLDTLPHVPNEGWLGVLERSSAS